MKVILILVLWLQEVLQHAIWQGGEGGVGRRKNSRVDGAESVHEVGSREGRDERAEVLALGKIDDVFTVYSYACHAGE